MKRFIIIALASLLLLTPAGALAQSPEPEPQQSPEPEVVVVNSFDLFWPISAGKVAGEPLYFLKTLKENIRGMLTFNAFQKAEYAKTLSEKRAVEAEKLLLEKKDYTNAENTLNALEAKWKDAAGAINNLENENKDSLIDSFKSSLEKQRDLLQYLETQVPEDNRRTLHDTLQKLDETLAQL